MQRSCNVHAACMQCACIVHASCMQRACSVHALSLNMSPIINARGRPANDQTLTIDNLSAASAYMYMTNALNDKVATATPYTHHSPRAAVAQQRWGGGQQCLDRACPCGPGHTLPVTCLRSSSRASLHCVGRSLRALLGCFQTPVTSVAEHHSQPYYYFYHYSTTTEILYLTYQSKTKAPEQPTKPAAALPRLMSTFAEDSERKSCREAVPPGTGTAT